MPTPSFTPGSTPPATDVFRQMADPQAVGLCLKCHSVKTSDGLTQVNWLPAEAQPHQKSFTTFRHTTHLYLFGNTACHQEHHGRNFQLQHLSDTQCQTCHSVQFASFEHGHPEFVNYPYRGRTPIFFDHASHLGQHFSEMKEHAPKSCQDCHVPDAAGGFMQVKSFAKTCAACHEPQIQGAGMSVKGAAFFTVPGIDVETLASKGISVGEWPKFADGKITPYQEILLSREPALRDALEKLRGVDLLDLAKASPEQLAATEQFAWGVKKLLFHLVVDGQSYLQEQLAGKIDPAGIEIPRAALVAAQQEWMPHLLSEVANYQNGVKPPLPAAARSTPAPMAAPNEKPASGDDDLSALAEPSPSPAKAAPADDSLGGDDLTAEAATTPSPSPAPAADDDLSGGNLLAGGAAAQTAAPATTSTPAPAPEAKAPAEWVAVGGWFRPADSFTLYYRPTGHADTFLYAWLNTAAQLAEKSAPSATDVFRQMADPQAVGLCLKCHSVKTSDGLTQVNWLPAEAQPHQKSFTTFRHTTHLYLFGNTACETCHKINPKAEPVKFFRGETGALADRDPTHFLSNFSPLSKTLCIECHQPKIAGDSCLLCHRYHAGSTTEQIAGRNTLRPLLGEK